MFYIHNLKMHNDKKVQVRSFLLLPLEEDKNDK